MKFKILSLLIVALLAFVAVDQSRNKASAQAAYTWVYNATNLYTNNGLVYEFASLNAAVPYQWSIWTVDMASGNKLDRIASINQIGTTTATWSFGNLLSPNGLWPENYVGPIYVIDNFGQTLGKHFVSVPPWESDGTNSWETSGGAFAVEDKQVIGNLEYEGTCKSVVHNPINVNGHHHGFEACQSTTTLGDIALLHIQLNPIGYANPPGTSDAITLINLSVSDVAQSMVLDLDTWVDYQTFSTYSAYPTFSAFHSFVIMNTGTQELPYVDYSRADNAFTSSGSFNPMRWGGSDIADVGEPGVFGCYRNRGAVVSDCESIWLVSQDPEVTSAGSAEWEMLPIQNVMEGGRQTVRFREYTEEIWAAYHTPNTFVDVYSGELDTTVYAFTPVRYHSYTVNNTALSNVPISLVKELLHVPFNSVDVVVGDLFFDVDSSYNITFVRSLEETVEEAIGNFGLDTDLGRTLLLGLLLFIGLVSTAFIPVANKMPVAYLLSWTVIGGFWIVSGFASGIGEILYAVSTIMLWVAGFTIFSGSLFSAGGDEDAV